MLKKILKKVIAIVLVFAMIMDVSTALAYAIGSDADSRKDNRTDIKAIINDRTYDPDRPLQQERSGVFLDKEVAEVVNNTSDPEPLEANNDTVLFENEDKRGVNVKSYSLTDGSSISLLYPITVHEKDAELFYILQGTAEYNDNGTICTVQAGDVTVCPTGTGHGIANKTDEVVEFVALIVYA